MKRSLFPCAIVLLLFFAFSTAEAQRGGHGGGGHIGGGHIGGGHIGGGPHGGPHFGGGAPFGGGSVVHRNFSPPAGMARPNLRTGPSHHGGIHTGPIARPDFPRIPPRTPHHFGGETIRPHGIDRPEPSIRPGGHGPGLTGRPIDPRAERPHFGLPDGRDGPHRPSIVGPTHEGPRHDRPGFDGPRHERPGFDGPGRDGPDWKHWPKIDHGKIHDSVIHRHDIDRRTFDNVRHHFHSHYPHHHFWSHDWFDRHPGCWRPPGPPPPPPFWWHRPDWGRTWGWFTTGFFVDAVADAVIDPVPYYYGNNIVYEGETVYINGVPYVSADEYYQQARDLAEAGDIIREQAAQATPATTGTATETVAETAKPEDSGWLPMGTFAIVADNEQTDNKRIVQIATDKQGHVRGNIVDMETDKAQELYGSVDPKTQRVAFKVRGYDSTVAECGLWNLTQDTVPLLVHLDENRTEERTLVRLDEKDETEKEKIEE